MINARASKNNHIKKYKSDECVSKLIHYSSMQKDKRRIVKKKGKWILHIFFLLLLFYSIKQQFYSVLFSQNDHKNMKRTFNGSNQS